MSQISSETPRARQREGHEDESQLDGRYAKFNQGSFWCVQKGRGSWGCGAHQLSVALLLHGICCGHVSLGMGLFFVHSPLWWVPLDSQALLLLLGRPLPLMYGPFPFPPLTRVLLIKELFYPFNHFKQSIFLEFIYLNQMWFHFSFPPNFSLFNP